MPPTTATGTPHQPLADGPLLVLVVSDDAARRGRARAVATFVDGVRVTEAGSAQEALRLIATLYEQPVGCPDILLLDEVTVGAPEVVSWMRATCPGVRIVTFGAATAAEAIAASLGERVAELQPSMS